ncbi:THAP domain-containing protein 1-like [Plodia interpunctella]|uniref:THAP domain-containing protein 1-like n=1 Tax=Plodia interpunctella TaxID=58824 RepID=UPI0023680B04|nr:THAP domain-containing protein 1-like [Plodia interpunctella]
MSTAAHCAVTKCKITVYNKPPGVTFHSCPTNNDMRTKWLQALKNKCSILDWSKSKICSRHFENKYFDSQRRLSENAIPNIFYDVAPQSAMNNSPLTKPKTKVDKILGKMTQTEIIADVKNCRSRLKEPNVDNYVSDTLKCKNDTPLEVRLWLEIKKQEHLNARLTQQISQNKKHIDMLQKNLDRSTQSKREMQQNIDNMKYIVKCLQEKHATLEEQIEILTAVEAR